MEDRFKCPCCLGLFMILLGSVFLMPSGTWAGDLTFKILPAEIFQGDAILVRGSCPEPLEALQGVFDGKHFSFFREGDGMGFSALLGLDMEAAPGEKEIHALAAGRPLERYSVTVHVKKKDFAVQHLTLPKKMVTLSRKDLERAEREKALMEAVLSKSSEERLWKAPFVLPVQGEILSPFGARRVLNQEPRNPHSGVDLRAEEGAPVLAPSEAVVALTDEHFFSGKSIVLDHGVGVFTMYFHLSEIRVIVGQKVAQGEAIGKVGKTGRATGPHLHWGVRILGNRVDPLSLLRLFQ
jgi:murein DD-endopeptidase MepM/ murein hydrolase activator NlpD